MNYPSKLERAIGDREGLMSEFWAVAATLRMHHEGVERCDRRMGEIERELMRIDGIICDEMKSAGGNSGALPTKTN